MKILYIFGGQGYRNNNLLAFFHDHQAGMGQLNQFISTPNSLLSITDPKFTQIVIGSYQLTLFRMLTPLCTGQHIDLVGYSLGEVNAFLASVNASAQDCIEVLTFRTQLMCSLLEQGYYLLSIVGPFALEEVQLICAQHHCAIAIINSNHHVLIGGKNHDLKALLNALQQQFSLRAKFLEIHLPSHTPFYESQKGRLQQFLDERSVSWQLQYPIISPLELMKIYSVKEESTLLDRELFTTLQWQRVCELISEYQYDLLIDLGPGDAMTTILKAANPRLESVTIVTVSHYNSLEGLLAAVNSCMANSKKR